MAKNNSQPMKLHLLVSFIACANELSISVVLLRTPSLFFYMFMYVCLCICLCFLFVCLLFSVLHFFKTLTTQQTSPI